MKAKKAVQPKTQDLSEGWKNRGTGRPLNIKQPHWTLPLAVPTIFLDGNNTVSYANTNPSGVLVRDILNVKKSDKFCCYGLNEDSRNVLSYMIENCSQPTGIALNKVQVEESRGFSMARIYNSTNDKTIKRRSFDRVYCDYKNLPSSQKDFHNVFCECFNLCDINGMILLSGLTDKRQADRFLSNYHITKSWILRETNTDFDLLFKKQHY